MKDKLGLPKTSNPLPDLYQDDKFEYKDEFIVNFDYVLNLLRNFP